MPKSHAYFALFVGLVLIALGSALLSHGTTGWTLIFLGIGLPTLAIISQQFATPREDILIPAPANISND